MVEERLQGGGRKGCGEEFGFDQSGGLTIPCEIETFKYLLNCIENHDDSSSKLIMLLYIILCTLSLANEFQLG